MIQTYSKNITVRKNKRKTKNYADIVKENVLE